MQLDVIRNTFDLLSHNPSMASLKRGHVHGGTLFDFCVPVNLHYPPPALRQALIDNLDDILRHYPDYLDVHQEHIASLYGLDPDSIVPANGSTEIITRLCQEAAGPLITCVPTFGRWTDVPVESGVRLLTVQRRPENDFQLDTGELLARVREGGARTLVISNPNNPTGAVMSLAQVLELAEVCSDLDALILDESFIDFSNLRSATCLIDDYPHVMVVKSLGKSLGWHGIRLGYAVAHPQRAAQLRRRLPFWNINGIAAFVLEKTVQFQAEYQSSFVAMARDRDYMSRVLARVDGFTVYPSQANFVLVKLDDGMSGRDLRDRLLSNHGILVRENSNKVGGTEQYVRLAVRPPADVNYLIDALGSELP